MEQIDLSKMPEDALYTLIAKHNGNFHGLSLVHVADLYDQDIDTIEDLLKHLLPANGTENAKGSHNLGISMRAGNMRNLEGLRQLSKHPDFENEHIGEIKIASAVLNLTWYLINVIDTDGVREHYQAAFRSVIHHLKQYEGLVASALLADVMHKKSNDIKQWPEPKL